ncbi:hypothetical protein [Kitasatospora sp. NPDC057015]|uniref:hypothetical protein n=1 Tax=Kitasatospora sp. NPDC057015 TaxID=3346001 RepID=UPI00363060B3
MTPGGDSPRRTGAGTGPDAGTVDAAGARLALGRGSAVVLPNPAPLTRVVAGTDPRAVNTAKGRPADQAVALWAHDPAIVPALDAALDLDARLLAAAHRLLEEERVTLLLPLRAAGRVPSWLEPACQDGWTLLFGARWTPLLPVLAGFPVLYVSSANRTGHPPAATAAEAVAMFPPDVPVLGTDAPADAPPTGRGLAGAPRAATTTLRLHPDGTVGLHRRGAQDAARPDAGDYLRYVRTAYTDPGTAGPLR